MTHLEPIPAPDRGNRDGLSRIELLRRGAVAAGALCGLSALGPYLPRARAIAGESDVDTLNFLLPFEYLQVGIYERGLEEVAAHERPMVLSDERRKQLEALVAEEREHVEALKAQLKKLGGKPVEETEYAYAFTGAYQYFKLAANLEQSAISAYNGAIPLLDSTDVRALAASIVQVEGRHIAAVTIQRHEEPAPEAFDKGRTTLEALDSIEKYTGPAIYGHS